MSGSLCERVKRVGMEGASPEAASRLGVRAAAWRARSGDYRCALGFWAVYAALPLRQGGF